MARVLILFSHRLTDEQKEEFKNIGVSKIVELPERLKERWSNVPPELASLREFAEQFILWIDGNSEKGDYVFVQGDFGLTNIIVDYSLKSGLIPIYSTTERIHEEVKLPDGRVIMKKTFKHKIFRRYERWEG